MQEIGIVTSHAPEVYGPESSRAVFLTFEGLRESRTIADKHTRVRITLPVAEAERLRDLLAEVIDRTDPQVHV